MSDADDEPEARPALLRTEPDDEREEHGPGGMDDIPDEPLEESKDPGGMAAIPDADPPNRESHDDED